MSKLLLLVALVCAVAYAQADAGTVQQQFSKNCGDIPYFNLTAITTGVCTVSDSSSSSYYFDSSNVYSVSFYGKNCSSDSVQSVTQFPTGCSKSTSFGQNWVTFGTSATLPFSSFPPSGFQVGSSFFNVSTADAKATACSAGNGVNEIKSASNVGYCNVRDKASGITTPSSTKGFCTQDGTMAGGVIFSDNTCTASAYAIEAPVPTGCTITSGIATQAPTCGSTAIFPSDIPTTSFSEYSDSSCKTLVSTTFLGSCFDSASLTCGTVNGTDGYATYSFWTASSLPSGSANGACPAAVTPAILHQVLGGTCVPFPAGQTKTYRMYSCTSSGPGASASTASVSIIATLFAAVAAVFAVRSL